MINLNNMVINLIESNSIKEHLLNIQHKFSFEEQLTIIYNSKISLPFKKSLLQYYTDENKLTANDCKNVKYIKKQATNMLAINETVYHMVTKVNAIILLITDNDEKSHCFKTIDTLEDYVNTHKESFIDYSNSVVTILLMNTSNGECRGFINCYIGINKDNITLNKMVYELEDEHLECECTNNYLDIPNDFKVGDTVSIHGEDCKYIVLTDSIIPESLKQHCDYFDSSIAVVRYGVLDPNKDYKEQIDKIIEKRVKNIETGEELDILELEHKHVHLTLVERI